MKIFVEMDERIKAENMKNEIILNISKMIEEKEEKELEIKYLKEKLIENQINFKTYPIIPFSKKNSNYDANIHSIDKNKDFKYDFENEEKKCDEKSNEKDDEKNNKNNNNEKDNEKNNENKNDDNNDGTRTNNPDSRGSFAFKSQLKQCRLIMAEKSRKREKDKLFPRSGLSSNEPRQRERTKLIDPEEGNIAIELLCLNIIIIIMMIEIAIVTIMIIF